MNSELNFTISDSVTKKYPDSGCVAFSVSGINLLNTDSDFYNEIEKIALSSLDGDKSYIYEEEIEHWKNIYRDMNLPRKKGVSSFESLYKRYSKKKVLPNINPFVDLYNAVSIKNGICIGAYDADNIEKKIILQFLTENGEMLPIGSNEVIAIKNGSVAYLDAKGIICSYWNYRDSSRTCVSNETSNIVVTLDVGINYERVFNAAQEIIDVLNRYYSCEITQPICLSKDNPEQKIIIKH